MASGRRSNKVTALIDAIDPVARQNGFEVVDIEIAGNSKMPLLRIYIDKLAPTADHGPSDGALRDASGITLDEIADAQAGWLEPLVDEADPFAGEYILEVSSPGIDRPLRTREHFERFAGEQVQLSTEPIEGRHRFTGTLQGIDGDQVTIVLEEGRAIDVPFDAILKAKVIGTVDFNRPADFGDEEFDD